VAYIPHGRGEARWRRVVEVESEINDDQHGVDPNSNFAKNPPGNPEQTCQPASRVRVRRGLRKCNPYPYPTIPYP